MARTRVTTWTPPRQRPHGAGGGPIALVLATHRGIRRVRGKHTPVVPVMQPDGTAAMVPISRPDTGGDPAFRHRRVWVVLPVAASLPPLRVLLDAAPAEEVPTYLAIAAGILLAMIWRRTRHTAPWVLDWIVGDWSGRPVPRLALSRSPSTAAPEETGLDRARRVLASLRWRVCLRIRATRWASYLAAAFVILYLGGGAGWLSVVPAAALAAAARAWRYRIRRPVEAPPEPETPEAVWEAYAAPSANMTGARMLAVEDLPNVDGWAAELLLVRGRQTVATLRGALDHIASAYDVERSQVGIEAIGSERRARLTVVERTALATSRTWRGPCLDLDEGTAEIMTLLDGTRAAWRFWATGYGTDHGWIFGSTGAGKSTAVDAVLGSIMATGRAVLDLVDLKGGSSLPEWRDVAYRYGTTPIEGLAAIERGIAVHEARSAWLSETRGRCIDPGQDLDHPLYLVVIEEFPQLLKIPGAMARAETIVTQGRATGVSMLVISQASNLQHAFGGSELFRAQLQAGNVLALRSSSGAARTGLGGMAGQIDLSVIPTGQGGTGYLVGPASQRGILGRVDYVDPPTAAVDQALAGVPGPGDREAVERIEASWVEQGETKAPQPPAPAGPRSPVRDAVLTWLRQHPGPHTVRELVAAGLGSDKGVRDARDSLVADGLAKLTPEAGQGSCQATPHEEDTTP